MIYCLFNGQNGFATLLVVLVLLVGMTTMTLTVSRSGILEQQLSGNDRRAQEAQKASEAALEYALAAAIPWSTETVICGTAANCPVLPTGLTGSDGGVFVLAIQYARHPSTPQFIKVTATATQSDNNSLASSSCYVKQDATTLKVTRIPGTWKDF